jgi:hypothetical protein
MGALDMRSVRRDSPAWGWALGGALVFPAIVLAESLRPRFSCARDLLPGDQRKRDCRGSGHYGDSTWRSLLESGSRYLAGRVRGRCGHLRTLATAVRTARTGRTGE